MDLGSYLRNAREARQLTLEAVAAQTKIRAQLWRDLEANDLKRWPKQEVYRRGFLRSYANAVGLRPDDVFAQYSLQYPGTPMAAGAAPAPRPTHAPTAPVRTPPAADVQAPRLLTWRVALPVGVLLAAVAAFAYQHRTAPDDESAAPPGVPQLQQSSDERASAGVATNVEPAPNPPDAPEAQAPDVERTAALKAPIVQAPIAKAPAVRPPAAETPAEGAAVAASAKPKAVDGTLQVVSDPPDALVTVNGVGRGKTPATIEYLAFGSYTIRVVQPGYRASQQSVTLDPANPRKTVTVKLRASP
jgi:cytoskeletal protein RodZ